MKYLIFLFLFISCTTKIGSDNNLSGEVKALPESTAIPAITAIPSPTPGNCLDDYPEGSYDTTLYNNVYAYITFNTGDVICDNLNKGSYNIFKFNYFHTYIEVNNFIPTSQEQGCYEINEDCSQIKLTPVRYAPATCVYSTADQIYSLSFQGTSRYLDDFELLQAETTITTVYESAPAPTSFKCDLWFPFGPNATAGLYQPEGTIHE